MTRGTLSARNLLLLATACAPMLNCDSSTLEDPLVVGEEEEIEEGRGALVPQPFGKWTTMPQLMDINPIHAVLLHENVTLTERKTLKGKVGTVLIVSGSGDNEVAPQFSQKIYDFSTNVEVDQTMYFDAFCAGISVQADGNPFMVGGTVYLPGNNFGGLADVAEYDVRGATLDPLADMQHGRWYPTTTILGDGRIMVDSGWDAAGIMNSTVEIYEPGVGWSDELPMGWTPPFYMRQHLLPDGRVFYGAPETQSRFFDPSVASPVNTGWTHAAWTNYGAAANQYNREYGSSVLLPLTPANNYNPKVLILGGNTANPTDTTELIDLGAAVPAWTWGPAMVGARSRMQATILPDETVLVMGGSSIDSDPATATLDAELYDPATNSLSPAGTMAYARLDHTVALLLPDATVWVAGSQEPVPNYEQHMEIYQPPYLFTASGALAKRPLISTFPKVISYNTDFTVTTPNPANIEKIVLVKNGSVTHAFNTDQRLVGLEFGTGVGLKDLVATAPPDENIAPPGYYMMFLINTKGVPSVATYVQLL